MDLTWRDGELQLLQGLLAALPRTRGAAALVTGSPGTGKSTLVQAVAERAAAAGTPVLYACASPAETQLPLGVVGQLLSGAGGPAVPAAAHPAAPDTGVRPREAGPQLLYEALRALRPGRPALVVVDDIHHTDEASAQSLLYLCGRLAATGVLLLLGGQPHPSLPLPLVELLDHARCVRMPLRPLPEEGVAAFLASPAHGAMDPAAARRLAPHWHRFTGGNPRLLRGLLDDHRDCEPARPARPVAGTAFRAAVRRCLRAAGTARTGTARALALLAEDATLTRLAAFLAVPERSVSSTMEDLAATGLLDGGRLRHPGVRAAVLEGLTAGESARLHRRAARVLHDDGAEPPVIAVHLLAAGTPTPTATAATAAAGADGADGADTAGGTADCLPADGPSVDGPSVDGPPAGGDAWAAPVLEEAARHVLRAGGAHRAAQFLRAAHQARGGGPLAGPALARLASAEWEHDPASVIRHLPALAGEPPPAAGTRPSTLPGGRLHAGPQEYRAEAAGLLLWHGRHGQAARAVAALGDSTAVREVRAALGYVRPVPGAPPALPGADSVEAVLESLVHGHAPRPTVAAVLMALVYAGETQRAAQWCTLTSGVEHLPGTPARRAVAFAAAAVVHTRTGRHDTGGTYAARALALLSPAAWGIAAGMPLSAGVRAATGRGAHEEAARLLRVPVAEAMFRTRAGAHYLLARGHHHLATGRARAALADFHACRDLLADGGVPAGDALDWHRPAAKALRALGERPQGDPVAVLTRAERRVAVLAADGCTNRAIAARLYVTPSTVEQHLTSVYRKLRVTSRAGLAELMGPQARPAVGVS
ncbi:helix-turn-helix transcriptional regulator [Streptomyces werraensis]|uniref:LuxR family transcriptional regulator n=1 Tax=Streptomyces werraensis TaxID=68284 RepID=A0ABV3JEI9_9ACTN